VSFAFCVDGPFCTVSPKVLLMYLNHALRNLLAARLSQEAFSESAPDKVGSQGVTGLREGTAVNDCSFIQMERTRCHALVNMTLAFSQGGSAVEGSYRCRSGTMSCRNQNDRGDIQSVTVRQDGLSFRVIMPDGSSCIFDSTSFAHKIAGSYLCLQGAAFVERGRWEVDVEIPAVRASLCWRTWTRYVAQAAGSISSANKTTKARFLDLDKIPAFFNRLIVSTD